MSSALDAFKKLKDKKCHKWLRPQLLNNFCIFSIQ